MQGIEIVMPQTEPTICGPVSEFKQLTLSSNAITMGWYGFGAGVLAAIIFTIAWVYIAPWVVTQGKLRGWWS
jgi:hypothetical protein